MLRPGLYPAAITPFDEKGRIDMLSVARLLAWFEGAGCEGAVLAGTNGEGPSLSAVEKRDLLRQAIPLKGKLDLILGIATCSSEEAIWLCKQAAKDGALATLIMPPFYFREASVEGVTLWFREVLDHSPLPVIIYNFPQRAGIRLTAEILAALSEHEKFAGIKDSSGERENILAFKQIAQERALFVGNETLLLEALQSGWSGSISGAANCCPHWLATICNEWLQGKTDLAETKFQILLPLLESIRKAPQPATHKALLARHQVISCADPRLPLLPACESIVDELANDFRQITGFRF